MFFLKLALAASAVAISTTTAANVTILQPGVPFVPDTTLPLSHAQANADKIVELFHGLSRSTKWKLISSVHMQGDTGEPEGMVRIGDDRLFVSAGTYTELTQSYNKSINGGIINGTDRTPGAGFAHLIVFDIHNGTRIADATLSPPGALQYHNGGIDYSDGWIWATIAQYRPNSTATVNRIDPRTLEATPLLNYNDHLGGIVLDPLFRELHTLNWGSRNCSKWDATSFANSSLVSYQPADWTFTAANLSSIAKPVEVVQNPSSYVDYQDCKFLGHPRAYKGRPTMFCSGVANGVATNTSVNVGGVALVDVETMVPVYEVPITGVSDLGTPLTENPCDVDVVDGKLRLYFMPDQHNSTLYTYEA